MSVIWLPYYRPSEYPLRYSRRMSNHEFLLRLRGPAA